MYAPEEAQRLAPAKDNAMEKEMYGPNCFMMDQVAHESHKEALRQSQQARFLKLARPEKPYAPSLLEKVTCRGLGCLGRLLVAIGRRLEALDMRASAPVRRVAHPGSI
jgi:hypothetical protein